MIFCKLKWVFSRRLEAVSQSCAIVVVIGKLGIAEK